MNEGVFKPTHRVIEDTSEHEWLIGTEVSWVEKAVNSDLYVDASGRERYAHACDVEKVNDCPEVFRALGEAIYSTVVGPRCDQNFEQAGCELLGRAELWDAVKWVQEKYPQRQDGEVVEDE